MSVVCGWGGDGMLQSSREAHIYAATQTGDILNSIASYRYPFTFLLSTLSTLQ